jgi:hypothetical protein
VWLIPACAEGILLYNQLNELSSLCLQQPPRLYIGRRSKESAGVEHLSYSYNALICPQLDCSAGTAHTVHAELGNRWCEPSLELIIPTFMLLNNMQDKGAFSANIHT